MKIVLDPNNSLIKGYGVPRFCHIFYLKECLLSISRIFKKLLYKVLNLVGWFDLVFLFRLNLQSHGRGTKNLEKHGIKPTSPASKGELLCHRGF